MSKNIRSLVNGGIMEKDHSSTSTITQIDVPTYPLTSPSPVNIHVDLPLRQSTTTHLMTKHSKAGIYDSHNFFFCFYAIFYVGFWLILS